MHWFGSLFSNSVGSNMKRASALKRAVVETLENRRLLSSPAFARITSSGTLLVDSTDGDDNIAVYVED